MNLPLVILIAVSALAFVAFCYNNVLKLSMDGFSSSDEPMDGSSSSDEQDVPQFHASKTKLYNIGSLVPCGLQTTCEDHCDTYYGHLNIDSNRNMVNNVCSYKFKGMTKCMCVYTAANHQRTEKRCYIDKVTKHGCV